MIIKDSERSTKVRVAMREGPGQVIIKDVCSKEDLYEKGRLYAQMVLEKDCGIGVHEHEGEKEIFVINEGSAIYNDDGQEYEVHVGDVMTQMTKGVVPATPHRVLHTGDASRHSVGFFLEPALSAPVTPADHPVGKPAVQDTYAFQLLRTLSSRVEWDGIAKDMAEAL